MASSKPRNWEPLLLLSLQSQGSTVEWDKLETCNGNRAASNQRMAVLSNISKHKTFKRQNISSWPERDKGARRINAMTEKASSAAAAALEELCGRQCPARWVDYEAKHPLESLQEGFSQSKFPPSITYLCMSVEPWAKCPASRYAAPRGRSYWPAGL